MENPDSKINQADIKCGGWITNEEKCEEEGKEISVIAPVGTHDHNADTVIAYDPRCGAG